MRQKALQKVLAGKATPTGKNKVVKLAKGQYVELARESTDKIFVVLAEFGDTQYPRPPLHGAAGRTAAPPTFDGSAAQQIPAPDRAVDNSHPVAGRLQPGPLRQHVLQPDGEVLRVRSPRAATPSRATSPSGSRCRSTRRATAATTAAASSATPPGS